MINIEETEEDENPLKKIKRSDTEIIDIEMIDNSEVNLDLIEKIIEITQCKKETAEYFLENSGGNIELAINKIMNEINKNNTPTENLIANSSLFKLNSIKGFNENKNSNSIKITDVIQVSK